MDYPKRQGKKILRYDNYEIKQREMIFGYSFRKRKYQIRMAFLGLNEGVFRRAKHEAADNLIFNLGVALVPFLFDLADFDEVFVAPAFLDQEQKDFFSKYFQRGLAEFRYRNGLNPNRKIVLKSEEKSKKFSTSFEEMEKRALVMNGAGKDSSVAGEITKAIGLGFSWFIMNPVGAKLKKIKSSGIEKFSGVSLMKIGGGFEKDRILKGHKPLSAVLAFAAVLVGYLAKTKYVIAGNEYSSNFGNLKIDGLEVNHQYSKSFEFEKDFSHYVNKYAVKDVHYFSILRPLYELQIAKIFSFYPQYFSDFISCNEGQNKGYWCKKCSKCAFVFLILYPFLKESDILRIFGENLFEKAIIRKYIVELCCSEIKPFECVGTRSESRLALALCFEKDKNLIKKKYASELSGCLDLTKIKTTEASELFSFARRHNFPKELEGDLLAYFKKKLIK